MCVAASKAVAAASVPQENFSLAGSSAGTWTRRVYLISQVRMSWGVLLCEQKAFPPAFSSAQLLPSPLPSPSVLPSSPSPTVSPSVFFSFSWLSGSELDFFQKPALSEEHSSTKRGSRQKHLSANSRFKGSPNSSETRTDRHFLASEVGEILASKLQWVIDTTGTNLEWLNDSLFAGKFPGSSCRIPISICLGTRLNCVACVPL